MWNAMMGSRVLVVAAALAWLGVGCAGGEAVDSEGAAIGERPHSLRGTDVDGRLNLDAAGRFVLDADAVRLFDYFLTTEGEVDDAARVALVEREAARVGDSAASVMAWYGAYCEYRRRFDAAIEKAGPAAELPELLARVRQARAETVGEHPLFAEDDALVEQAIATKRAMAGSDAGEAARRMQFTAMFSAQSEADVIAGREARVPDALRQLEAHLRASGADARAIRAARVERVGTAAADRLEALDAQRMAWQARVDAFAVELHGIDSSDAIAREALLASRFDEHEARRVRTVLGLR